MHNPYGDEKQGSLFSMSDALKKYDVPKVPKNKRARKTERGELLAYFAQKLGWGVSRVAFQVQGLNTQDLYFLKSDCDQASARGVAWSAAFWTAVKVAPDSDMAAAKVPNVPPKGK